jgi:type II secretory pathway component GspD/PulD (secretin)
VIGGLIQDRFERIDRKIPILGDIPLIGPLFRNKSESTSKTELLIVLTPHVVSTQEEIDAFSRRMIGKTSIERELRRQIERGELEGMPGGVPGAEQAPAAGRKGVSR